MFPDDYKKGVDFYWSDNDPSLRQRREALSNLNASLSPENSSWVHLQQEIDSIDGRINMTASDKLRGLRSEL